MNGEDYVGARVRYWRRRRRLTQQALAGLVGVSQGYISQIESGVAAVDKRSTLIALAEALQVAVADLVIMAGPEFAERSAAEASVPAIRAALNAIRLGDEPRPGRGLVELAPVVDELEPLWRIARYDRLAGILPGVLRDLHALSHSKQRGTHGAALRSLVRACRTTSSMLHRLGLIDLAGVAADVGRTAAETLGEPTWQGVAAFTEIHALPMENRATMHRLAGVAADRLSAGALDNTGLQVLGMLHLTSAFTAAVNDHADVVRSRMTEAQRIAAHTGEGTFAELRFGPTNIQFWATAIAVNVGEGGRVREILRRVNPGAIGSATRQAAFYTDVGRGLAQTRKHDAEAVAHFVHAEALAPQQVRLSPMAQDAVGAMLRRARKSAGGPRLQELAARLGVAS